MGYVSGMLSFVSTPGAIFGCIFAGYFYDIFGRRHTIGISLLSSSILLALVPWTSPDIFPWLISVRIAFSMFLAVPISNPLSADYIQKNALGRGMSL
jgi:MFS family permease